MYLKTNQYHIQQFAYLTQRMKDISEGDDSLLDHSILMMASSLFDGDAHGANQLPIVLTGKGDGTLKTGRVLDYLDKGDDNRKILAACTLVADGPHGRQAREVRRRHDAYDRPVAPRFYAARRASPDSLRSGLTTMPPRSSWR